MMKKRSLKIFSILLILLSLPTLSFGAKPKKPMKVSAIMENASGIYELANSEIASAHYLQAEEHLDEAAKLSFSVDNTDLLCKISLSRAVIKYYTNSSPDEYLAKAKKYASRSTDGAFLLAVCRLYEMDLVSSTADLDSLAELEKQFLKQPYYLSYLYRIKGNHLARNSEYKKAELAYLKAAEIHVSEAYITEIGLDWYSIARMRSIDGNKKGALEAIENALKYDRDAENTSAIASDYFARAMILVKGNPDKEEIESAIDDADWAREIFISGGYDAMAEKCRLFIEGHSGTN